MLVEQKGRAHESLTFLLHERVIMIPIFNALQQTKPGLPHKGDPSLVSTANVEDDSSTLVNSSHQQRNLDLSSSMVEMSGQLTEM